MYAGFFDVLHDSADDDILAIGQGVDVDLSRGLEKVVDQDWTFL